MAADSASRARLLLRLSLFMPPRLWGSRDLRRISMLALQPCFLQYFTCFKYALKYTAVVVLPIAMVFVWWRRAARRVPVLLLGAAILISPWVLRNWLWLGNPAAPFLNHWFPNPHWTDAMENSYLAGLAHYPKVKSYFDIPLQLTVIGGLVPGFLGPMFLMAPISLLALRQPQGRRLLLASAVFAIPA